MRDMCRRLGREICSVLVLMKSVSSFGANLVAYYRPENSKETVPNLCGQGNIHYTAVVSFNFI